MNTEKLDNKLFELTKRFAGGNVSVQDLKEVLDAILEEPKKKCPCSRCFMEETNQVKNG